MQDEPFEWKPTDIAERLEALETRRIRTVKEQIAALEVKVNQFLEDVRAGRISPYR